ncbi:DUF2188 domain-containing protein [Paenibacillus alkaliterrae]|uniref:DUF2188 domain-containing protein n=1 Tax=Paenibacillus alkaliterrae TaxID=320909 RepID=UPI001F281698|nr:DUF2188 domain-containing protein [Paenibacillus alkaliterrae]MCF2938944.1 DUF2188 domain-containing protein [Paenibacillus alkaliterrae]
MGFFKKTKEEAFAYARERAQRLGSDQLVIVVDGGYRVGGEKTISRFFPNFLGWYVRPIY